MIAVHERMTFSNVSTAAFSAESANKALRRALRKQLDEAVAAVGAEVPAEAVVAEGGAVQMLAREAERLDLLVVGSRGQSGSPCSISRSGGSSTPKLSARYA